MKVSALLFGISKDLVGSDRYEYDLVNGNTVIKFREQLIKDYPSFEKLKTIMVAVNNEYAEDHHVINPSDEIAIIPPVSGG